ncbi:hypothetical protein LAV84_26285 [Rhizobium sp. VS19-DR104.2]|uniref:hypothetical protein n=1 Tax=unclassified Rhizobium TaxID=2613769 RepID=UPI001C5B6435|nr:MULTISPECIES: hypothetical protein [unclassified Rhizobium]MBZ5763064.1 hypothetical protein [Rhizobium sp. VS19-DR96]MBZ5768940.1 hypothetical protein [Rhizobium sp. VS19-DR129.2]MBZ5776558.1 hypothetical protein [Rhizobium sp. VS19-DRK62.2]MBZ5787703.1 hypothetical protein [Rhizobium sp. VS19-DR121]MBZ5805076.1 hypothetical protein [Rhizobium sp. VS19-DR181]
MKRLIMIAGLAMLAGCVNPYVGGNVDKINPEYARQHLIRGKTTKEEVRRAFGEPSPSLSSIQSNGTEDWVYTAEKGTNMLDAASSLIPVAGISTASHIAQSGRRDSQYQLLKIWFDKRGIVDRWGM